MTCISYGQTATNKTEKLVKIEMNLSAFGVESDDFPSINAVIDFSKDSIACVKTYYNPSYNDTIYYIHEKEISNILNLLKISDIQKLKPEYKVTMTDQPSSKTTIYTTNTKYVILDYGLKGENLLIELYKIVYKY